ncbi:ANTAR domain-containing protein [Frankineae bacterium MT45]|nr:ANTAR domain-containing protein [Frankineae bacterium MT45]
MRVHLTKPSKTFGPRGRLQLLPPDPDRFDFLSNLQRLVSSSAPAVAFTSLAALSVPTLSDECHVAIKEGPLSYQIQRPIGAPPTRLGATDEAYLPHPSGSGQMLGRHSILTPILSMSLCAGRLNYHGVVLHHWTSSHRPTHADATLARLAVDRVIAAIDSERVHEPMEPASYPNEEVEAVAESPEHQIGSAIGVLILKRHLTYDDAYALLESARRRHRQSLHDVALEVLRLGDLPGGQEPSRSS